MSADLDEAPALNKGRLVARTLAGSWRAQPEAASLSAKELDEIAPLLLGSGSGALAWRRVQHSHLRDTQSAGKLKAAYYLHTLQAATHQNRIRDVISRLHSAGIESLLGKGWSVARSYPEIGLRPYGDIDLYVRAEQYKNARAVLFGPNSRHHPVDLHSGFGGLGEQRAGELYRRSRLVNLADIEVRLFGPEDHLRLLCMHLLKHGGWRPLWLCDVGLILESVPRDFDWDYCLRGNRRRSDAMVYVLMLAHGLLGAGLGQAAEMATNGRPPGWLVPAVLRQWGEPSGYLPDLINTYRENPTQILRVILDRWPDPVSSTFLLGGYFNGMPRLPYQIGWFVARSISFLIRRLSSPRLTIERLTQRGPRVN